MHDVFAFENSLYTTVSRERDVSASAMLNPMEPKKQWEITTVVWIRQLNWETRALETPESETPRVGNPACFKLGALELLRIGWKTITPRDNPVRTHTYSTIAWKGSKVELPLTHYWIVRELCTNPGKVRTHRDLMKASNIVVEPNTITAHVKTIRGAFSAIDPGFNCIKTERGRGYRWVADQV